MIDSDGRHYVTATTAEAGIPLSIAEIRRALVAGEELTVHTLVTPATSPAWYLNYLSKDFYWFEMANYVGFDVESWNPDTGTYEHPDVQWIQLRPLEYDDYAEGSEIITRSPSQFWAPPETYRLPCAEVENCIDFRYIEIE